MSQCNRRGCTRPPTAHIVVQDTQGNQRLWYVCSTCERWFRQLNVAMLERWEKFLDALPNVEEKEIDPDM